MADEYIIPFGVDATGYLKGVSDMDAATDNLGKTAEDAGKQATSAFTNSGKAATNASQAINQYEFAMNLANQRTATLANLNDKLRIQQNFLFAEKDISRIADYNKQIEATQKQIAQLSNAGKTGFDDLGNALDKTTGKTNVLTKSFSFFRQAAYLIPGIGLAGIFNLIGEAVLQVATSVIKVGDSFDAIANKTKVLTSVQQEANKSASSQLTDLKFLYAATQDVTKSTEDRTKALVSLKAEFPDAFKGISDETVLNGGAAKSYDDLTTSILNTARATAAKTELDKVAAQILDIEFQKQKIRNASAQQIAGTKDITQAGTGGGLGGGTVSTTITKAQQDAQIAAERDLALKEQDVLEKRLNDQSDFLVKFAGGQGAVVDVIEAANLKKVKSEQDAADKLAKLEAEELRNFQTLFQKLKDIDTGLQATAIEDNRASQLAASDAKFKKIAEDAQLEVDHAKVTNAQRVQLQVEADKVILDAQAANNSAKLDINKKFDDQQQKLAEAAQKALDSIGADSQDRQLAAINKKYEDITEAVKKGGLLTKAAEVEIQNARLSEISDNEIKFGEKAIDDKEKLDIQAINSDQKYADKAVEVQKAKQLAILAVELKAAEDTLALLKTNGKTESDEVVKNAEQLIANLKAQIANVTNNKGKGQTLFEFLGISTDAQQDLTKYAAAASEAGKITSEFLGNLADSTQQAIDAKQRLIDQDDQAVSDLQDQLTKQQDLQNQGLANNVDAIQKELDAKKKARAADLASQQDLQKKQNALKKAQIVADSISQVSNLITAATEIFAAFAEIPIVGVPLAIAAIALMFGSFAVAKVNAFNAVGQSSQSFGEGGIIDGKAHTAGGQKYRSIDGKGGVVELEGGEHVTNKRSTKKYASLLEAINADDLSGMSEDGLRTMFGEMGIGFGMDSPREAVKTIHKHNELKQQINLVSNPDEGLSKGVQEIATNTRYLADKERNRVERWEENGYIYERKGNKTVRSKK